MATKTRTIVRYRRPKVHHRARGFTVPLAVVAGFLPLVQSTISSFRETTLPQPEGIMNIISRRMTGYNPLTGTWDWKDMKCGTFAILGGFLVHYLVGSKLGVNRVLARTNIPFIRI